jgi:hypothetical protein
MRGSIRIAVALAATAAAAACGPHRGSGDDDGGDDGGGADANTGPMTDAPPFVGEPAVYAHTASTLFKVDPDTLAISRVGDFQWSSGFDQMTDIAIDAQGMMIGISFTSVYRVDPDTAAATLLTSGLAGEFNGLSFVPGDEALGMPEAADVLVATRNLDGLVFSVDPMTGQTQQIGNMGGGFSSSGDLVSVRGFGTAATANGLPLDRLVRLTAVTFAAQPVGSDTGNIDIWGVAFWGDRIYGFTEGGAFVLIDPATGAASFVTNNGEAWWGAAVTTRAPVIE